MFLVGFAASEAESTWVETRADISGSAQSQSCHFCLRFKDATSRLENGLVIN